MLYPKKEKKPNTAIKYEVREFIHGGIEYVTDCPFGECGQYTHALHKVVLLNAIFVGIRRKIIQKQGL